MIYNVRTPIQEFFIDDESYVSMHSFIDTQTNYLLSIGYNVIPPIFTIVSFNNLKFLKLIDICLN